MTTSLLLDQANNDVCTDVDGSWALCTDPYAAAQDAACAIRTFVGDLWFDQAQGIPFFSTILGKLPPLSYLKLTFANACLTVPSVAAATCFIGAYADRRLSGQVLLTLESGEQTGIGFASTESQFILGLSILGGGGEI